MLTVERQHLLSRHVPQHPNSAVIKIRTPTPTRMPHGTSVYVSVVILVISPYFLINHAATNIIAAETP